MAGGPTAGGQDALGDGHAVEVVGAGLDADEDDLLAALDPLDRVVGAEDGTADGGAGRGVEALGDRASAPLQRLGIELVAQELVDLAGSMRPSASSLVMMPSSTMSTAIFTAAAAVRLPERVWSM